MADHTHNGRPCSVCVGGTCAFRDPAPRSFLKDPDYLKKLRQEQGWEGEHPPFRVSEESRA
jgi:hypothetical protein